MNRALGDQFSELIGCAALVIRELWLTGDQTNLRPQGGASEGSKLATPPARFNSPPSQKHRNLRRIHNFALDMNWLPWPVLPKKRWPAVNFKKKRAITWEEHGRIVERETNPERKAFYQLAWYTGASQTDLALLEASNIDCGSVRSRVASDRAMYLFAQWCHIVSEALIGFLRFTEGRNWFNKVLFQDGAGHVRMG